MKQDFGKSIERLLDGIKSDYLKWSSPQSVDDDRMKQTKLRMIDEFNQGVRVKFGRKYTKVLQGSSVWGFICRMMMEFSKEFLTRKVMSSDGRKKKERGSIFDSGTNWFRWTE